jgi:hypothetical protein
MFLTEYSGPLYFKKNWRGVRWILCRGKDNDLAPVIQFEQLRTRWLVSKCAFRLAHGEFVLTLRNKSVKLGNDIFSGSCDNDRGASVGTIELKYDEGGECIIEFQHNALVIVARRTEPSRSISDVACYLHRTEPILHIHVRDVLARVSLLGDLRDMLRIGVQEFASASTQMVDRDKKAGVTIGLSCILIVFYSFAQEHMQKDQGGS